MSASANLAKQKSVLNRADFVRQFPLTVSSKDIVAKAKEQGLDIPSNYVSAVRSKMRNGKANGAAAKAPPAAAAKTNAKAAPPARAPNAKRKVGRPRKVAAPPLAPKAPAAKAAAPRPRIIVPAGKGIDREFYQLVLDIGLVRAETLLENFKARALR